MTQNRLSDRLIDLIDGHMPLDEYERNVIRKYADELLAETNEILEFFFGQMQMHSPQMDGQHSYRFNSGGWPMTHCKGPTAEKAVNAAIKEIRRATHDHSQGDYSEAGAGNCVSDC